ncbi:Aristolochene synthase [Colletotrichum aenigma]|uniref:Aristolochene synthase n=1 Tax=Colletotrichum aenigma TaxID=1215731 RepID=UPI0018723E3D|nr:Aristolochene synthase [Colletotrichum aenigma]KAF5495395.1 Aristolochene synthase [Colletotrichum aenigma]
MPDAATERRDVLRGPNSYSTWVNVWNRNGFSPEDHISASEPYFAPVGSERVLLLALKQFSQGIYLSKDELESTAAIEVFFSHHMSVVNDVTGWDKERCAEREIDAQGSLVSNIVQLRSEDCRFSPENAKSVLWAMCEEWSKMVDALISKRAEEGCFDSLRKYLDGLKMRMCGNELWSRNTFQYNSSGLPSRYAKRWWTADLTQLRQIHTHWKDFLADNSNIWKTANYLDASKGASFDKILQLKRADGS